MKSGSSLYGRRRGAYVTRLLLCIAGLSLALPGQATNDPYEWLERMAEAVDTLNYHGTLVYMRPGKAETFHIYHRVENNQATERVVAMDGDGAEIIRTSDEVICIFPAQQKVMVDKRRNSSGPNPLRASLPEYTPPVDAHYTLQLMPGDRAVGRAAVVVDVKPHDGYRYGYSIWLDEQTAMPLKIQLVDRDDPAMPVEELFFTSISMPTLVALDLVRSSLNTDAYAWTRNGESGEVAAPDAEVNWRATQLPDGFMQTAATFEYMAHSEQPRIHLVYSDGLASVSVFIDIGVAASEQAEGLTTVGGANAYSLMMGGLLITAMGEVPARTVRQIATSMELDEG